ncbi:endonuclease MutS2 [candidate division KSB1 bacterium]|nr:MAG: endonuclease MutS2 [candidate division KSB1 bacterium]
MISEQTLITLEFDRVRKIAANLAVSTLGGERISALAPFAAASEAEQCLMRTTEMIRVLTAGEFPLHGLTDCRAELAEASVAGAALAPESLLHIAAVANAAHEVRSFLLKRKQNLPLLFEMSAAVADLKDIAKRIDQAIEHDGTIRDEASGELKHIRQSIRGETRSLEDKLQGILHRWGERGVLQDNVISFREGRFALPVRGESRASVQGVIIDQSASGATVFMEPLETLEISNRLRQLENEERREIHRILLELTALVHERIEDLVTTLYALIEFDEYYARGRLALRWDGVNPELSDRGRIRILRGRHPLLLERMKDKVVPLDFEMLPPLRAVVISGPNAGGKTVVLKTVGLFCVMAAAGLFVPAAPGSELPFFAGIHADIGDSQSIESDLSTFTAHVRHLQEMVSDENPQRLILIDEIGASTDPALGAALAQAVLLELVRKQAVTLVTTHHGTLKAFAHETDGVENGSMAFDEQSLKPTYNYRPGLPGSSYAFEIAERVGFPKDILQAAREFAGTGMMGLEQLVSELSRKIEEYEKLRRESDLKLTEYAALQKLYTQRTKELTRMQAEVKAKAVAEADVMIDKASRDMEAAIRDIKKEKASRDVVKQARETFSEIRETVEKKRQEAVKVLEPPAPPRPPLENPAIGNRVEIESLEGIGTIVSLQKGGKRAEVEIGGARLWVDANRLFAAPEETKSKRSRVEMKFTLDTQYVSDQLDLRGKYGDEALPMVDSYLAAAAESNLKLVTLIHGKGTGALRIKVHEFLNGHPLVKSYHDGGRNSDDFGSTVVELN